MLWESLAPPVSPLSFKRPVSKEVLQNTCVYVSVQLSSSHQGSEDTTSPYWLPGLPWDFPTHTCPQAWDPISAQPRAINPVTLQLASPSLVRRNFLDVWDSPGLATLPLPDAHRNVNSTDCHHHPAMLIPPGPAGCILTTRILPSLCGDHSWLPYL